MTVRDRRRFWLFKVGPANAELLSRKRPYVYTWPVPTSALKGDLLLLYATRPLHAIAGIGRICSDAVQTNQSRRKGGRAQRRAWVQLLGLEKPISLETARATDHAGEWGGLANLAGSFAKIPTGPVLDDLLLLAAGNVEAESVWGRWERGVARFPGDLDLSELAQTHWEKAPPGRLAEDHEKFLQDKIERHLLKNGWRRPRPKTDGFTLAESRFLGAAGYPDLVLIREHGRKKLLVVEVKKNALPRPGQNGLDQLDRYVPEIKRLARGWAIEPWLVARTIHDRVLRNARAPTKCFLWRERPQRLEPV